MLVVASAVASLGFALQGSGDDLAGSSEARVELTADELELVLQFSPLPPPPRDPTNAVYESETAARLGQALFYDVRFSGNGAFSCATCHDPKLGFADGRQLAKARAHHPRHTMSLWNVGYNRWFFWDGRKDTLWSQALAPLEDPREQASSRLQVIHTVAADAGYARAYAEVFGPLPDLSDAQRFPKEGRPMPAEPEHPHAQAWVSMQPADQEAVNRAFVNVGKAIAAFERQLVSDRSPFDVFVEGLRERDAVKQRALSESALRGLKLFVGKARCHLCHDGPTFTDLEFHDSRIPVSEAGADPGRSLGIKNLLADPFNSLGAYSDDRVHARGKLSLKVDSHRSASEFKTPTLRNIVRTAPYMHEGQFATLSEVVEFYSTLEGASPLREGGERLLQPLDLAPEEKQDLVAFLESLTDETLDPDLLGPPVTLTVPRD